MRASVGNAGPQPDWTVMLRALSAIIALITLSCVTVGCSSPQAEFSNVSADELSLGNSVFAISLSPQTTSFANGATSGYIILVDEDGRWRSFETTGMDNSRIAWTEHGLYFTDTTNDYILNDELTTIHSPKANLQQGLFPNPNALGYVAIYNDGATETGYSEQVVATADGKAVKHDVEGAYWVLSQCDDAIFGVADVSGQYLDGADPNSSTLDKMFNRIYPSEDGHEAPVATHPSGETGQSNSDAPCVDGVVHYLSSVTEADGNRAVLRSWDSQTGEFTEHNLVNKNDTQMGFDVDDILFANYGRESVVDGALRWFHRDGSIYSTELATGRTTRIVQTTSAINSGVDARVIFDAKSAFVLNISNENLSDPMTLVRYDLTDGTSKKVLSISGIGEKLSVDLVLREIAVAPKFAG